jgi:hypothetical protein
VINKTSKSTNVPAIIDAEGDLLEFKKAVEAIAIKPHAGKLTLLTRKLNNVLLAEAQAQGIHITTYRIALSKLCSQAERSTNMEIVKDQLRKMASTTVEWNAGVKGSRRWGITSLLEVEVIEEGNRCWVEWGYPAKLKEKILAPDVYARLSLQMQNNFRSNSALALYEICLRYVNSPGHMTMRKPWKEWRPILTGDPDDEHGLVESYPEYKYFKRDIVKPSMEEVNTLTGFDVTLIEHKVGRSVADIQFLVVIKNQNELPLDNPNLFDLSLVARIKTIGFTQVQAEKIYSDHDENKLRSTLDYIEKKIKTAKPPIKNPQAYFKDALTKGYGIRATTDNEDRKAIQDSTKPNVKDVSVTKSLSSAWLSEAKKVAKQNFDSRSPSEQKTLLEAFEANGIKSFLVKKWKTEGLKNQMCVMAFIDWMLRDVKEPSEIELLQFGLERGLISTKG